MIGMFLSFIIKTRSRVQVMRKDRECLPFTHPLLSLALSLSLSPPFQKLKQSCNMVLSSKNNKSVIIIIVIINWPHYISIPKTHKRKILKT